MGGVKQSTGTVDVAPGVNANIGLKQSYLVYIVKHRLFIFEI